MLREVTVRFDVYRSPENNGACRINVKEAIDHLCVESHAAAGRQATYCDVRAMHVESIRNTSDFPVQLKTTCPGIKGNFQRTSKTGVHTRAPKDQHVLYVIHPHAVRTCTPPASVHQASPFCASQVFRDFHMALDNQLDFERYASHIGGTDYIEFVSPDIHIQNGVYQVRCACSALNECNQ